MKEDLVKEIKSSHHDMMTILSQISPESAEAPNLLGHWSAWQTLAHFIGWQEKAIEVIEGVRDGHEVIQPEDEDIFNAESVAHHAGKTWHELKDALDQTTSRLLDLAESLSEEAWNDPRVGWFRGSTINHYRIHKPDFERAV